MRCPSPSLEAWRRAALLAGALALVSPARPARAAEAKPTASESGTACRFLRVRGLRDDGSVRWWRFSATDLLDLELVVGLPSQLTGEHRVDVEVYTPDEHLYRTLTMVLRAGEAAASPAEAPPPRRKLSDLARPVDVQQAERDARSRSSTVRATLPVAGTSIVSSSLYGRWTAVAYLDGSTEACVAPRAFRLRP